MTAAIAPIVPYLTVSDAAAAVEFYKNAFGAVQDGDAHRMPGTDKMMHVRLMINGSLVMLADDLGAGMGRPASDPVSLGGSPVVLALSLEDVQSFWDRAVGGGMQVTMPLADMFWGDRYGQGTDPFGHRWSFSQTLKQMSDAEMQAAADTAMAERGTLMGEAPA